MAWTDLDEARNTTDSAAAHVSDHNAIHAEMNRLAGGAFAGISCVDNATETTITTQDVFVQVTVFDTNEPALNATPDHTNDHITIDTAGTYLILCSATINSVGAGNRRVELSIRRNNGSTPELIAHVNRDLSGGGGESGVVSLSGISSLALNDTVELWVANETNTSNLVIEDCDLSVLRMGD